LLLIGGGAVVAAGAVVFGFGQHDIATVQNAPDGTALRDIERAHERAPLLVGTGIALAAVGVATAGAGLVWSLGSDASQAEHARTPLSLRVLPNAISLRGTF
jgi:hypothetical protein